jgi:N12 class adenine-specific DNA methylase
LCSTRGILATVSQIQTGRAKRPLICVPKAVYKNWIKEIRQLFPGIKINELNNLRSLGDYKNADGNLNIPEGSLSVCTYEGLQAISFKKETIDEVLMGDFAASQQSTGEHDSQRKKAQELEKIRTDLGKATKSTDNSVLWENTGFDHITIDEMHNFKNVFGEARAKEKGEANEFQGLTGGTPSDRAMKAFAITQLIQRNNNGRNVFGLTATPFTNSPIEIYNILSLVAREELEQTGIFNLHEFMAQFALLKSELAQTAKGDVELRTVMKEFKNLPARQNLINTYCV